MDHHHRLDWRNWISHCKKVCIIRYLIDAGANLVLIGRKKEKVEKLMAQLKDINKSVTIKIIPSIMNLADPTIILKNYNQMLQTIQGQVDILILAHGIINTQKSIKSTVKDWDKSNILHSYEY
jgi:NADP-dependent 3-hydroxy acid dehydrogenase YdfG